MYYPPNSLNTENPMSTTSTCEKIRSFTDLLCLLNGCHVMIRQLRFGGRALIVNVIISLTNQHTRITSKYRYPCLDTVEDPEVFIKVTNVMSKIILVKNNKAVLQGKTT